MKQTLEEPTRYSQPGFFVARRASNQSLTSTPFVNTAAFDTSVINDNGCFDFGTSEFVCPKAGRMFVAGSFFSMGGSASNSDVLLEINISDSALKGGGIISARALVNSSNYSAFFGSGYFDVDVGARVKLVIYCFNNPARTMVLDFGTESQWFCGHYVS